MARAADPRPDNLRPMSMPFFTPGDDPGSDFPELLRRVGLAPYASARRGQRPPWTCTHATTCVAVRYADGVVMAGRPPGHRRATSSATGRWRR